MAYECLCLGDLLVDLEVDAIDRILKKIYPEYDVNNPFDEEFRDDEFNMWLNIKDIALKGRRVGCGITGLADMFAALGLPFGDKETLEEVGRIIMTAELDATIDLAILKGTFEEYKRDDESSFMLQPNKILPVGNNSWYDFVINDFPEQYHRMYHHGRRNVSFSTIPPAGTISIIAEVSNGIEPLFEPMYIRRVRIINEEDKPDFIDTNGIKYKEYLVVHPKLIEFHNITRSIKIDPYSITISNKDYWYDVYLESPYYQQCANDISYKDRINTQSILQKYITSSISSTINLPENTKENVVADIYMLAYESGLKGITIYRDKCRDGIFIRESKEEFPYHNATKRPKVINANIHHIKIGGNKYSVFVGLLDNRPYEVFVSTELGIDIPDTSGKITKVKKGHYRFESNEGIIIDYLDNNGNNELERACALYTSMLLRHGADIKYVIKTAKKINDNIGSFVSAMSRVLAKYTKSEDEICPKCGGRMVNEAGCKSCKDCGHSFCNIAITYDI